MVAWPRPDDGVVPPTRMAEVTVDRGPTTGAGRGMVRLPRALHPGAWWLWALGLATAASHTTNPLPLALRTALGEGSWVADFVNYAGLAGLVASFFSIVSCRSASQSIAA